MSCGCEGQNCPPKFNREDDEFASLAKLFQDAKCFGPNGNGVLNIFSALLGIKSSIDNYTDTVQERGYASALINFRANTIGQYVTNGQIITQSYAVVPFTYKVTGFGASVSSFSTSGGPYPNDDQLTIKLLDVTSGIQYGPNLTLNANKLHDKVSNEGKPINLAYPVIPAGHRIVAQIIYNNTDGGAFSMPNIDFFIHVEPVELVTFIE